MKIKKRFIILGCVIALILGCGIYVRDYYVAGESAIMAMKSSDDVCVQELEDGTVLFHKEGNTKGLIFYPGGKVEHRAYAPLLREFSEHGISCVLVKMPCNLAVLDMDAADGMKTLLPEITQWYMGGHSLGGSMAASYIGKHRADFEGLMLFAAYATEDLSDSSLQVFSCYGANDGVLNLEKYRKYESNLPKTYQELVVSGGNHAGFGDYGKGNQPGQKGDGKSTISLAEQVEEAVDWIVGKIA